MATPNLQSVEEHPAGAVAPPALLRSPAQAEALVIALVQRHADDLIRVARRHTRTQDDANDAYQRSLELLVRNARRLEAATAHRWLFTVCRHEAIAVGQARATYVGVDEAVLDGLDARWEPSPEDEVLGRDDVLRAAEALGRLKPDEVRALWLRASGLSYAEIQVECGWSHTKVNRLLSEGRASLVHHRAELESGGACARFAPLLSASLDGEGAGADRRELRRHLRSCGGCRAELRALHDAERGLGVLLPAGVLVTTGAASGGDHVPAFLVRLYEAASGSVHERVVALTSISEAASGAKLAAVAAASAALAAGGGAVAVHEHGGPPAPAPAPKRTAVALRAQVAAVAPTVRSGRPEVRAAAAGLRSASGAVIAGRPTTSSSTSAATRTIAAATRQRAGRTPGRDEFGGSTASSTSSTRTVAAREFVPAPPASAPAASGGSAAAVGSAASAAPAASGGPGSSSGAAGGSKALSVAAGEFGGP